MEPSHALTRMLVPDLLAPGEVVVKVIWVLLDWGASVNAFPRNTEFMGAVSPSDLHGKFGI